MNLRYQIMFKNPLLVIAFALVLCTIGSSCLKENFTTNSSDKLRFSVDTLMFDTVFTTVGSATRILKVFNDADQAIKIERIHVESADASKFIFNVDGIASNDIENVEVPANDSIYIFGEVTVDPDAPITDSPFIIEDKLKFLTNGNDQFVLLTAWGQNAIYFTGKNKGGLALLSCDFDTVVWDDPKPYVVYGALFVDSCSLVLPAGCEVYVHGGIVVDTDFAYNDGLMLILSDGSIVAEGTFDEPVIIQGDRLESDFDEVSGQWGGIRIFSGSENNSFSYTTVKNSIVGIRADSMASVSLDNCQIYNTSSSGLIGIHAKNITANNCLFYGNGGNSVQLVYGGDYNFKYCTFANYGNQDAAVRFDNFRCVDPLCLEPALENPITIAFSNCIIAGSNDDEISLADIKEGMDPSFFEYSFENTLFDIDEILDADQFPNFFDNCTGCMTIQPSENLFLDPDIDDYHLDTLSIAEGFADPLMGIAIDLEDNVRDGITPDAGCYEYQY